jgi:amino acid transporter
VIVKQQLRAGGGAVSGGAPHISAMAFVGLTCAMVASVRNIPDVAATGWTMFFYMFVAAVCYALPIALISAEYACMFPHAGGPELWMTSALGKNWGFITAWLLWAQMFPGVVTSGLSLAALLGEALGVPALQTSKAAVLACILCEYWTVTLLAMRLDIAKLVGRFGVWLGLYIPVLIIFILGASAFVKILLAGPGVDFFNPSVLGQFRAADLLPNPDNKNSLAFFTSLLFIFAGIELSSVYIPRLANPRKSYMKSVIAALAFTFAFSVVLGFLVAAFVPRGGESLSDIAQPVGIFCEILGVPKAVTQAFSALTFLGITIQGAAWAAGPSKAITESAKRGMYPPRWCFWKANKYGNSSAVLLTQACAVSIISFVCVLIPEMNSAFLILINASAFLFNMVYLLMIVGIVVLRIKQPAIERPFRIGGQKTGNARLYAVALILFLTITAGVIATFAASSARDAGATIAISAVILVIPLVILALRKEEWEKLRG